MRTEAHKIALSPSTKCQQKSHALATD